MANFWTDLRLVEQFGPHLDVRMGEETLRDMLIRSLLRIRPKKGGLKYLKLNRAQRAYSERCTKRNIVLKARQVGITTYIAARFFLQTITKPGTLTVQVAHSDESAEAIFNMVHRFWANLPNKRVHRGALVKSRSNVRQIVFPRLDSEYRVETADDNAGRGLTIHQLHCSEIAHWPRGGREMLASLQAAVVPDGEIVLESTPNGASGIFYEEWHRAAETGYATHFFPWWFESSYKAEVKDKVLPLTDEERSLVERFGLSDEQIAWRRKKWKQMREQAAQEYAEDEVSCFLASGECVFDLMAIEQAAAHAGRVVESQENGRTVVWFPPNHGGQWQYIIGVDTAGGGTEGDYSCAQVIERSMGLQCAELHGHFPPYELARRLVALGQLYENALIAVERNNHGYGVLAHLKDMGYQNLYEQNGQAGWLTSVVTRPAMVENLSAVLMAQPELFHSPRLLAELKTFVRHPDGNGAAAEGAHDDCVMAMAIAHGVRREDAGRVRRRGGVEVGSLVVG